MTAVPPEVWASLGECRTRADAMEDDVQRREFLDIFYPDKGQSAETARQVCRECPVIVECLEFALKNNEEHGVWGGTSPVQRKSMRRRVKFLSNAGK